MYRVGICDDGINTCSYIETCLLQIAARNNITVETEIWYSGESLWQFLQDGNHIDMIFLDIELLTMTGIEVGRKIRTQLEDWSIQIVYISGKSTYAQSLFKTQPMDFLIKPLTEEQITGAFLTARKIIAKGSEKFEFQNGRNHYFTAYKHIIYFSSVGRTIRIVTFNNNKEFYGQLKEIAKKLPDNFIPIHKSYIINKQYIMRYDYEMVELENGVTLPISKPYRKQVRQTLLREG